MKKIVLCLAVLMTLLTSCGSIFQKLFPMFNDVKEIMETTETTVQVVETKAPTENEAPEGQNEFFEVLDVIKDVHPGTAGSSLKVAAAAYKFINNCRVKLPFDIMAGEWVKKQDKSKFSDINESFAFVYESLDQFKDNKMIKGLLADAGIDLPNGVTFDGIIEEAKKVLQVIIDATK